MTTGKGKTSTVLHSLNYQGLFYQPALVPWHDVQATFMTDEQIFFAAIELDCEARDAYLRQACRSDVPQLDRIRALLAAHQQADSLLDAQPTPRRSNVVQQPNLPRQIGDFEILRELGRGGMGVVYEARQKSLKRKIALKVLSSGLGLSSKAILRFRREAEAAGKLHHTNIVPIYTTGEDKGIHYYAMEMIDGPSLDAVIRELKRVASGSTMDDDSELPPWVHETALFANASGGRRSITDSEQNAVAEASSELCKEEESFRPKQAIEIFFGWEIGAAVLGGDDRTSVHPSLAIQVAGTSTRSPP